MTSHAEDRCEPLGCAGRASFALEGIDHVARFAAETQTPRSPDAKRSAYEAPATPSKIRLAGITTTALVPSPGALSR